jgi:hypothetical protein
MSACSLHAQCAGLSGECCPTAGGTHLGCCGSASPPPSFADVVSTFASVSNLGSACSYQPAGFCGAEGVCCQMGVVDVGCAGGTLGCHDYACCVSSDADKSCYGQLSGEHTTYALDWEASGATFLDDFEFAEDDFNFGAALYLNRSAALAKGLVDVGATSTVVRTGARTARSSGVYKRESVRLESTRSWTYFLIGAPLLLGGRRA